MNKPMARVTKKDRCPICGHDTWCLLGERYNLCMRVQGGKQHQLSSGEMGWLYPVNGAPVPVRASTKLAPPTTLDAARWMADLQQRNRGKGVRPLAELLGVSCHSLDLLECTQVSPVPDVYAFPMRNGDGGVVGVRLRNLKGDKWAVKGSHQGLFIPQRKPSGSLLVVEGPTDCAAALTIGYSAIGRPSCSGGIYHIQRYVAIHRIRRVVIVSDLDDPGMRGAMTLAEHLPVWSALLLCPAKDMRAFVNQGGDKPELEAAINQLIWREPSCPDGPRPT